MNIDYRFFQYIKSVTCPIFSGGIVIAWCGIKAHIYEVTQSKKNKCKYSFYLTPENFFSVAIIFLCVI